jgi:hypothetical protein
MAVKALAEEQEQQEQQIIIPAPAPTKLDGGKLLEAFTPRDIPSEDVPTLARNDTTEVQLSQLGGGESYDDIRGKEHY